MSLLIITLTLAAVAVGRIPKLRMNRATIALVGATLLVITRAITVEQAYRSIDMNTIVLLLAMMIINANLRLSGFFNLASVRIFRWAHRPALLLLLVMIFSGVLSAVFLNDTIVLVMTPLLLEITLALGLNPLPFLMGLATAANIGSAGAITGNPQNMLIGVSSGISFVRFSAALMPPALAGLVVAWVIVVLVYRRSLAGGPPLNVPEEKVHIYRPLLQKSMIALVLLLVLLFSGVSVPLAAICAACVLLVTRRVKPERVFQEIDWSLLVFFSGLFVVTAALETSGWYAPLSAWIRPLVHGSVAELAFSSAILSNLTSNVPAVLLLRPMIEALSNPERAWLTLAMATTFAGNLTLVGSVANLIVAEAAARQRVQLSFLEYLKVGIPVTLLTLALGVFWLS